MVASGSHFTRYADCPARGPSLSGQAIRFVAERSAALGQKTGRRLPGLRRALGVAAAIPLARAARRPWVLPVAITLLLAPAAMTWAGAVLLTRVEAHRAASIRQHSAGALAASTRARAASSLAARIAPSFAGPTIGDTIARIARILPHEADVVALGLGADGAMMLTIAAADPDRLREVLRHDPFLAGFREVDQAGGDDGRMRIGLRRSVR